MYVVLSYPLYHHFASIDVSASVALKFMCTVSFEYIVLIGDSTVTVGLELLVFVMLTVGGSRLSVLNMLYPVTVFTTSPPPQG